MFFIASKKFWSAAGINIAVTNRKKGWVNELWRWTKNENGFISFLFFYFFINKVQLNLTVVRSIVFRQPLGITVSECLFVSKQLDPEWNLYTPWGYWRWKVKNTLWIGSNHQLIFAKGATEQANNHNRCNGDTKARTAWIL